MTGSTGAGYDRWWVYPWVYASTTTPAPSKLPSIAPTRSQQLPVLRSLDGHTSCYWWTLTISLTWTYTKSMAVDFDSFMPFLPFAAVSTGCSAVSWETHRIRKPYMVSPQICSIPRLGLGGRVINVDVDNEFLACDVSICKPAKAHQ
jgi:hypothetical protein